MALRTMLWAKDQTVITSTVRWKSGKLVASASAPSALDKLVLIGIGDEASEHSWDALIGLEDLAVFAGCTRRAVRESLGRLERAGYIQCRQTQVESGQNGWCRIYLLSDESPLMRGQIEVDFATVEQISRYMMRTFRDRHDSTFVPSDSVRYRDSKLSYPQQGEHGSSCGEDRGNMVPPAKQGEPCSPCEGEHGSSCEGEHGSSPSVSSLADSDPDPEEVQAEEENGADQVQLSRTATAADIAAEMDLKRVDAQPKQVRQIRHAVEVLLTSYDAPRVRAHAVSKAQEAKTCTYLLRGLGPEYLDDAPDSSSNASSSEQQKLPSCNTCGAAEGAGLPQRIVDNDNPDSPVSMKKCPDCHPQAGQRQPEAESVAQQAQAAAAALGTPT